jgi:3-phenylpropionate/trans-cinnamate dioxygenase ferredoxin component
MLDATKPKETEMAEAGWVRVAAKADVAENSVISVRVGDKDIAVYHLAGGEYRATDNICTHEYAQLHDGWLEDGCIECPLHAARFDVRTGKALCAPADVDLAVFEIKAEGDDLLLKMPG